MSHDLRDLRSAFGHFATGVTVVTTRCSAGTMQGITANSFTSVSLEPALILVSLSKKLGSFEHFQSCEAFAVHLLGDEHRELSGRFASRGIDKWQDLPVQEGLSGVPLLPSRLGLFQCTRYATYDGGDHEILLGKVEQYSVDTEMAPLIFYKGGYRSIAA